MKQQKSDNIRIQAGKKTFSCQVCGKIVSTEGAGSRHRNHCPFCLSSVHLDNTPGDRSAGCGGIMDPICIWVRKGGDWAVIHRCQKCGALSSNRIAADDDAWRLLLLAVKPLSDMPFPAEYLERICRDKI